MSLSVCEGDLFNVQFKIPKLVCNFIKTLGDYEGNNIPRLSTSSEKTFFVGHQTRLLVLMCRWLVKKVLGCFFGVPHSTW